MQVQQLVRCKQWDVFLNLCDGAHDEDTAGIEVAQTLQHLGAAYTGAAPHFYEPTKPEMKAAVFYHGIYTAPWAQIMDVNMEVGVMGVRNLQSPCSVIVWVGLVEGNRQPCTDHHMSAHMQPFMKQHHHPTAMQAYTTL